MTAINFPPLHRGGRIFADFAMCNCFSKNLGLGEGSALPVGVPIPGRQRHHQRVVKVQRCGIFVSAISGWLLLIPLALCLIYVVSLFAGWDDGRGLDSGRAILSYAADKMRKHTHGFLFGNGDGNATLLYMNNRRKQQQQLTMRLFV
jgi:hypothetical protein